MRQRAMEGKREREGREREHKRARKRGGHERAGERGGERDQEKEGGREGERVRETETEDERERQRGEKNREGEGKRRDSHKRLKNHRIKTLCLSVTLYRYTNMNPNIWAHCIYSMGVDGQQYRIQHAPQVQSISQQTKCRTMENSYLLIRNAVFHCSEVGEESYQGILSYFSRCEVSFSYMIHGKVCL